MQGARVGTRAAGGRGGGEVLGGERRTFRCCSPTLRDGGGAVVHEELRVITSQRGGALLHEERVAVALELAVEVGAAHDHAQEARGAQQQLITVRVRVRVS